MDKFKNIFNEFQHEKEYKKIDMNVLIYNMKKRINENDEQIGLFFLSYHNLCNLFNMEEILKNNQEKNSNTSSKKRKNRFK